MDRSISFLLLRRDSDGFVVLFCHCVAVAIFPMMTQAADPALAVKRVIKDQSCESEGNMLYLCWNMLFWTV